MVRNGDCLAGFTPTCVGMPQSNNRSLAQFITCTVIACSPQVIQANRAELFAEVWSWRYIGGGAAASNATALTNYMTAPLGGYSSTESDAIQLWSYGFLATDPPTSVMT